MPTSNPTGKYSVLTLIFISVVINYMDRANISVAASALSTELELSKVQMGFIFSAFAWTYSLMQIPGGMLVDLIKIRILYPFILVAWSLATLIQGFVSSLGAIIGCRIAIGFFEAPSYPANNKIVTHWFPTEERAGAIAVYTSGQFIGLAFLLPVLTYIQTTFGWRGLFIISGLIGIVWAAIWYLLYRDPEDAKQSDVEQTDNALSESDSGEADAAPALESSFNWNNVLLAFSSRKLWGVYISQFCLGGTFIFFLTWFPSYLEETRGLSLSDTGIIASIPFIAAFFGVLLSGFVSDALVRRGFSNEFSRKTPVILGLILSSCIIGANYVETTTGVTIFLSIAFFGNGLASINWVFVSLLAPKNMLGVVGGCFNFIGGMSAVIVPIAIGYLAKDGDYRPALALICGLAIIGVLSYLLLVGKVETVEFKQKGQTAKA